MALHALTDALLGAAALGAIGKLFPDPIRHLKVPTAASCYAKRARRIQAKGYTLGDVDVTIIAQAPKCSHTFHECACLLPKISAAIWMMLT